MLLICWRLSLAALSSAGTDVWAMVQHALPIYACTLDCQKMLTCVLLSPAALLSAGTDVWAMVRRTVPNQECPLDCDCMMCRDKEEWTALVQMISLTKEQIQKLLIVRWGSGVPKRSLMHA